MEELNRFVDEEECAIGINDGVSKPQLNLIYLLDTSGTMGNEGRIDQLNYAMRDAIQAGKEVAADKETDLYIRVAEFNSTVQWIYGDTQHGVEDIEWQNLTAGGRTNTAEAIMLAKDVMHRNILGTSNYKPVVILVTDGLSNDPKATLAAIDELKNSLKSSKSAEEMKTDKIIRIAIGVKDANRAELEAFASRGTIEGANGIEDDVPFVFEVDNIENIKNVIKNITVSSIASAIDSNSNGSTICTD